MVYNLPNILSLSRIATIPLIIFFMAFSGPWAAWMALFVYSYAAITDYFDGYLARQMKQTSVFGQFIDPIADKLLVASVIFMLVAFHKIDSFSIFPALVILLREFIVSGLREFLAGIQIKLPVSNLAKWKTGVQMVSLGFLIIDPYAPWQIPAFYIGIIGIWIASILTLLTGWEYLRESISKMNQMQTADFEDIDL